MLYWINAAVCVSWLCESLLDRSTKRFTNSPQMDLTCPHHPHELDLQANQVWNRATISCSEGKSCKFRCLTDECNERLTLNSSREQSCWFCVRTRRIRTSYTHLVAGSYESNKKPTIQIQSILNLRLREQLKRPTMPRLKQKAAGAGFSKKMFRFLNKGWFVCCNASKWCLCTSNLDSYLEPPQGLKQKVVTVDRDREKAWLKLQTLQEIKRDTQGIHQVSTCVSDVCFMFLATKRTNTYTVPQVNQKATRRNTTEHSAIFKRSILSGAQT